MIAQKNSLFRANYKFFIKGKNLTFEKNFNTKKNSARNIAKVQNLFLSKRKQSFRNILNEINQKKIISLSRRQTFIVCEHKRFQKT